MVVVVVVCVCAGLLACWLVGLLACWIAGLLAFWLAGLLGGCVVCVLCELVGGAAPSLVDL